MQLFFLRPVVQLSQEKRRYERKSARQWACIRAEDKAVSRVSKCRRCVSAMQ